MNYFWVSTNPKEWKVDEIRLKGTEFFESLNQKGNKRKIYSCFEKAQRGDQVLFYEGAPASAIVARGEVVEPLHDNSTGVKGITLKYISDIGPLTMEAMSNFEPLNSMVPVRMRSNATIYEIMDVEFFQLLDCAKKEPVFLRTSEYLKNLYYYDYEDLLDIKARSIIGRFTFNSSHILILVQINPADKDYGQDDFETDLRLFLDKLEKIIDMLGLDNFTITLGFEPGGQFIIPQSFIDKCRELGITDEIHGSHKRNIHGVSVRVSLGKIMTVQIASLDGIQKHIHSDIFLEEVARLLKDLRVDNPNAPILLVFKLGGTPLPQWFIDLCIDLGITIFFEFDCGSLQGRIIQDLANSKEGGPLVLKSDIPIKIKGNKGYSQDEFDKELRKLLAQIRKNPNEFKGKKLIFQGGGDLDIPPWLKEALQELDIKVEIVDPERFDDIWNVF